MIKFDVDFSYEQLKYLNEKISEFSDIYFDCNDNFEEDDFSCLFPNIIYRTKESVCREIAKDLYLWCNDDFHHTLSALHNYAMLKIIEFAKEIDEDFRNDEGKSCHFTSIDREKIIELFSPDYQDYLLMLEELEEKVEDQEEVEYYYRYFWDLFTEEIFTDYDFMSVADIYNLMQLSGVESVQSQLGINFDNFKDLLPPDIEKEYENLVKTNDQDENLNLFDIVKFGVEHFNNLIEYHDTYKLLWEKNVSKGEKAVQTLFHSTTKHLFEEQKVEISPETNSGRGAVDFKFSNDKSGVVLLEVKLASNKKIFHGLEKQLTLYLQVENATEAVFLVIIFEKEEFKILNKLKEMVKEVNSKQNLSIEVVGIDATNNKPSASVI